VRNRCIAAVLVAVPSLLLAGVANATAAAASPPAIVSFTATPHGASVLLTATVRRATSCSFSGPGLSRTVACSSGRATATVPTPRAASVTYTVVVRGKGGTARRTVKVTAPQPTAVLTLGTATVAYSGDVVHLTYSSTYATSCTLAADPALWSGANPARVSCNGSYDANIGLATAARSWTFTFTAANAAGRTATSTQTLTQTAPAVPTASLTASATTVHSTGGLVHLTYTGTNAVTCSLSSSPTFVIGANPITNCSGTYDVTVPSAYGGRTTTFTFTAANGAGQTATSTQTVVQPGQSSNWSGYIEYSSSTITSVSGTWTVPRLDCSKTPNAGASEWVGIGGAGASTGILLQTGISTDCAGGVQTNSAWWELLPAYATYFHGFTISVGDTIQATVFEGSNGSWETRVDDVTTGRSGVMVTGGGYGIMTDGSSTFPISGSANVSYSGGYSAEWIVEAYEANGSQVGLAAYGTVTFSNLTSSVSLSSLTLEDGVELVTGGTVLSWPAAPSGSSFSISYSG